MSAASNICIVSLCQPSPEHWRTIVLYMRFLASVHWNWFDTIALFKRPDVIESLLDDVDIIDITR